MPESSTNQRSSLDVTFGVLDTLGIDRCEVRKVDVQLLAFKNGKVVGSSPIYTTDVGWCPGNTDILTLIYGFIPAYYGGDSSIEVPIIGIHDITLWIDKTHSVVLDQYLDPNVDYVDGKKVPHLRAVSVDSDFDYKFEYPDEVRYDYLIVRITLHDSRGRIGFIDAKISAIENANGVCINSYTTYVQLCKSLSGTKKVVIKIVKLSLHRPRTLLLLANLTEGTRVDLGVKAYYEVRRSYLH